MSIDPSERNTPVEHLPEWPTDQTTVIPPVEHRDEPERGSFFQRNKRRIAIGVGVNAVLAVTAGLVVKKEFLDPLNDSLKQPGVSGPRVPGQSDPTETTPNTFKLPNGTKTMDVEPAPDQQQGTFDKVFSPIISERVDHDDVAGANEDDLDGLTGGQNVPGLVDLAHRTASSLKAARERLANSEYNDSDLGLVSDIESTTTNADGTTTNIANLTYLLLDKDGVPVGHMIANTERFGFTYKSEDVQFEDGKTKTIEVLTDVEDLNSNDDK